ncbi:hypothetical protein [Gordonia sp. NPDC003376]
MDDRIALCICTNDDGAADDDVEDTGLGVVDGDLGDAVTVDRPDAGLAENDEGCEFHWEIVPLGC